MSLPMTGSDGIAAATAAPEPMTGQISRDSSAAMMPPSRRQPTTKRRAAASAALAALGTVALLNAVAFDPSDGGSGYVSVSGLARRLLSRSTRRRLCATARSSRVSRRLEEELCEQTTPYITEADAQQMSEGSDVSESRSVPSHVALCRELITRSEMVDAGEVLTTTFGLKEGEDVCLDFSAPHFAMMEIFASDIVAHVGNSAQLRTTYLHDCWRDELRHEAVRDGRDYTTAQMELAKGGLGLEDPLDFATIKSLCKGCIQEFEGMAWDANQDVHQRISHHCLLYPGGKVNEIQSLTFDEGATEDEIAQERRRVAQDIPLAAVMPSVQDKLRMLAAIYRSKAGRPIPEEPENGAVIVLDSESGHVPFTEISKHISRGIKSIQILSTYSCSRAVLANGESCLHYGQRLRMALREEFPNIPDALLRHDIAGSSAAVYARVITAYECVIPPGTVSALLPVLAKEEGTECTVLESSRWPITWGFFNFVRQFRNNINVVDIGSVGAEDAPDFVQSGTVLGADGVSIAAASTATNSEGLYATGGASGGSRMGDIDTEDCLELQGRAGSWEMDYDYDDLAAGRSVHGSNARGANDARHGAPAQRSSNMLRSGAAAGEEAPAAWRDAVEQCRLESFSRRELCDVMKANGVTEALFAGDRTTLPAVQDLLAKLGMDPASVIVTADRFNKDVGCPEIGYGFRMVFIRNDLLDVQGTQIFDPNAGGYMTTNTNEPPPPPPPPPQSSQQGPQYVAGGGGYTNNVAPPAQYAAGGGGYVNTAAAPMQFAAMPAMPMAMSMPVPMYSPYAGQCVCHPWAEGYQQPPAGGGGGRKLLVASMGASDQKKDLEGYKRHFDNFRRLAETISRPDDIVVYRTTPPEHGYCPAEGGGSGGHMRRLGPGTLSDAEVRELNRHAKHEIHKVMKKRRLTKKPRTAQFHVLDVEAMTAAHPHATDEGMKSIKCDDGAKSDIHDHWNRMLFSMLKNIQKRESRMGQAPSQQAPPQTQQQQQPAAVQPQPQAEARQAQQELAPQQAARPDVQPAAGEFMQQAWEHAKHQKAVEKQSAPEHQAQLFQP